MPLAVIEPQRLDRGEARERPGEASGRILTARKQHQRSFGGLTGNLMRITDHASRNKPSIRLHQQSRRRKTPTGWRSAADQGAEDAAESESDCETRQRI